MLVGVGKGGSAPPLPIRSMSLSAFRGPCGNAWVSIWVTRHQKRCGVCKSARRCFNSAPGHQSPPFFAQPGYNHLQGHRSRVTTAGSASKADDPPTALQCLFLTQSGRQFGTLCQDARNSWLAKRNTQVIPDIHIHVWKFRNGNSPQH